MSEDLVTYCVIAIVPRVSDGAVPQELEEARADGARSRRKGNGVFVGTQSAASANRCGAVHRL